MKRTTLRSSYVPNPAQIALLPFARQWQINALTFMMAEKRNGTTATSADCLFNSVRIPSDTLEGAPRGTNARYFAREIFTRDVIGTSKSLSAFVSL